MFLARKHSDSSLKTFLVFLAGLPVICFVYIVKSVFMLLKEMVKFVLKAWGVSFADTGFAQGLKAGLSGKNSNENANRDDGTGGRISSIGDMRVYYSGGKISYIGDMRVY